MSSQILKSPIPYIALIMAHLIWGGNFVVAKITLQEFPPLSLAFLRFAFASIFIAPFLFAETKKIKIDKKDLPRLMLIGVLMITVNISFFFEGITRTTAINASVLTLIIPIISVVLGWWLVKEHIYIINLVGIVLGLLGALIVIGLPEIISGEVSPEMILGNFLIILASISWVLGATLSHKMLKKYPSLIVTGIAFLVGTITFIIPSAREYFQNPLWPQQISLLGFMGLLYMTLLSSISAYFLFEWGLAKVGVIKADLLQYIEPFVAAGLAITILGEQVSGKFIIGSLCIVAGVFMGTFAKEIHHRHKHHRV